MDAIKLFKGLFIHNAESGSQISGSQSQVNVKVSPSLIAGVKSTIGGSEVHAIDAYPDYKGVNRLAVENGGFAHEGGRQTLINYSAPIATGATPASIQFITVTPGKTLYVTLIANASSTVAGTGLTFRDGIADGGAIKCQINNTISSTNSMNFIAPLKFTKGIRLDVADQVANQNHNVTITGWEE